MPNKISEELSQRLKNIERAETQEELPVIVTVKKDVKLDALEKKGLKIEHSFESINAVSGTLPAAAIKAFAELDEVEHIDYDGEVFALPQEDDSE